MLKTNELFARLPKHVATQLFDYLTKEQGYLLAVVTDTLCKEQKLRPVFVQRKSKADRITWLQAGLGRAKHIGDAAHLLQVWLVGSHSKLLCDFLDALGISHDENGTIEELPEAPDKEKLKAAIETVLANHNQEVVATYLHAFQATDENGWATLEELLAEDPRLKI